MPADVLKVLVVDDDDQDFILVSEALDACRRTRFQVEHVATFQAGRQALMDPSYDAYLVDYFLDTSDGAELISEAKRLNPEKPLIVLTGADRGDLDDQLIEMGAADFLPKNEVAPALLERIIRHAIERKQSENRLARMVKQDALTGLGNRQMFEESLEFAIARAKRQATRLAVVFLDLDRFKDVNDTLGHHVGDLLLILIADRLQQTTRGSDIVARISGDEFTLLLDDISAAADAGLVAEKLLAALQEPTPIHDTTLNVTASLGIACYPDNGDTPMELMQKADMALYESKRAGSGHYCFFTDDLQARLESNIVMEQGLRNALENGELELHFQPQWCLSDRQSVGVEALLRWRQPDGRMISPVDFIPVAEKTGLIVPIGNWVVEQACRTLRQLQDQGFDDLKVAINLSAKQLRQRTLPSVLGQTLDNHGVDVSRLELELTEESFIETGEEIKILLGELKALGCRIAIDDFGTGYSSMRYLKHFPVDRLKIDKSFVSGAGKAVAEPAIVTAICNLGHSLQLELVAEGVETQEQARFLLDSQCATGQGFLVARPMPLEDLLAFLRGRHTRGG